MDRWGVTEAQVVLWERSLYLHHRPKKKGQATFVGSESSGESGNSGFWEASNETSRPMWQDPVLFQSGS